MLKKLLTAALMACALAGCSTLAPKLSAAVAGVETVYAKVQAYWQSAPKTVYALRGGYDIAQGAAAAFKTAMCPAIDSHTYCASVVPALRQANHQALDALDAAEAFVRANPTLDASVVIAGAQAAVTAFAKIETENGVPAQ